MKDQDDFLNDEAGEDLELLLRLSVSQIIRNENSEQFLHWFRDSAMLIAPEFFKQFPNDMDARRSFLSVFGRAIWNRTPLPSNHFRTRILPKPERNAPCTCGSGRKFKQCCASIEALDSPFENLSLLSFVLDGLTASQRKALPYAYLNHEELAFVARQWMEEGREKDAVKLLEGLFADFSRLDERAEAALDCLLDCYDLLNNPLKKKRLLERAFTAPNKHLRAAAMQRQCCILADRNEFTEGWALFQELQRLIPNDPSLSHLEVVMLIGQGEKQRAADRARFWMARLAHDKNAQGPLMEFLRSVAQGDATGAMTGIARKVNPAMDKLVDLIRHLPKPEGHYTLKPMGDSAGPLKPDAKVRHLIQQWEVMGENAQDMFDDLNWLENNPLAFQSLEILDDWLGALESLRATHGFEEAVLIPLLQHAEAVLRLVLKKHHAEKLQLEWGWHENRPALTLLARLAAMYRIARRFEDAVSVMAWMVWTLNPNDNQGMREILIHDYLRLGRVAEALTLAEKFPDDMAGMAYGLALALFMNKQEAAALETVKIASERYPQVRKMLLADKPKQPKLREGLVRVGGKDEAWYYRQDHLDLWQSSGGLEWLRQQSGRTKKS
ncbi:MAG: SEC-C metal-binding domain-containing protein [Gallionella sp.]